jgi:hypothetical protein
VSFGDQLYAAVCARGHVQDSHLDRGRVSVAGSHVSRAFCGTCGAKIMTVCRACNSPILGLIRGLVAPGWRPTGFCWNCGTPYPWATRQQRVAQLYNLIDEEDLDEADRLTVVEQIAVLSAPEDDVSNERRAGAGEKVRQLAPKAWEAALPVLQSVLTAEAKRRLGLP